jgi:hypothetical protein
MKNKKAILASEVLKLVLAALCIFLLFLLAFKLYGIFTGKSDLEKATATLEAIVGKANGLEDGESTNYLITSLEGWGIFFFNKGEINSELCKADNCLCICKSDSKSCLVDGVCNKIDLEVIIPYACAGDSKVNCYFFNIVPSNLGIKKIAKDKVEFLKEGTNTALIEKQNNFVDLAIGNTNVKEMLKKLIDNPRDSSSANLLRDFISKELAGKSLWVFSIALKDELITKIYSEGLGSPLSTGWAFVAEFSRDYSFEYKDNNYDLKLVFGKLEYSPSSAPSNSDPSLYNPANNPVVMP